MRPDHITHASHRALRLAAAAAAAAAWLLPTPAARATYTWATPSLGLWSDPSNWSSNAVPDSANDAALANGGFAFVTANQSANDLSLSAYSTVETYSDNTYGYSTLNVHNATVFSGNLDLAANDNYQTTLNASGTIDIRAAGQLNLFGPASGFAFYTVAGDLTNAGAVSVDAYTTFTHTAVNNGTFSVGSASTAVMYGTSFFQAAGTLTVNNGSTLRVDSGGFAFTGGSVANSAPVADDGSTTGTAGAVLLTGNSVLLTTVADGGDATFSAFGNLTLASDLPAHTNVMLSANNDRGYANLYTPASFTNHGSVSVRADEAYTVQLMADDGTGTVTNPGTLNFSTNGAGSSSAVFVSANLVNSGTLNASVTTVFARDVTNTGAINLSNNAQLSMTGQTFNQNAGTLGTTGSDRLNLSEDTFNLNGGQVKLTLYATGNNTVNLNVSDGQGLVINAQGNLTLGTAFRANTTLNLNASQSNGYGNLYVNDNATNFGHVFLHDDDSYFADIHAANGAGNFNNAGLLEFASNGPANATAAATHFYGTFVNTSAGTLNTDANLVFTANASNSGSFNVGNGATLYMNNARFNQDAGNLGNSGQTHFRIYEGGFNFNGGAVHLTVDFTGDSYVSTAVANAGGAAFNFLSGTNGAIHGDLAPGANVYSVASDNYSNLYVDNAASNHGSITLTALNNYTNNLYVGDGSAGNPYTNYGTINLNAGTGSSISVGGNVRNVGTLNVTGHATFQHDFTNDVGATLAVSGTGSNLTLSGNITPGGSIVAQGGGNIVAQGGGNIVAQGGGNIVAQGGGNIVAQGGGNIVAQGGGNLTAGDGLVNTNGSNIVAQGGGNIVAQGGGNIVAQGGGNIVAQGGGNIVAQGGGNLTVHAGGLASASFVGHNGSAEPTGIAFPSSPTSADPSASIIVNATGTIDLQGGDLQADNSLQIDSGATLTGFGTATAAVATAAGTINPGPDATSTLTLHAPLTLSGASVTGPGTLLVTGPLTIAAASTVQSTVRADSLSLSAPLDLTTSTLTLTTADPDAIRQALLGRQLFSSTADADAQQAHALAYLVKPDASFAIQYSLIGDANLDGKLNADDYALLDRAIAKDTTNALWTDGDFNYDGDVDQNDYLLIDAAYARDHALSPAFLAARESQFGAAYLSALLAAVPEPTSATACLFAAFPLLARRRARLS